MEILQPILTSLIGLIGVLIGLFINEYFRRRNRVELYSKEIFQKRLSVYEKLYEKIYKISPKAQKRIEEINLCDFTSDITTHSTQRLDSILFKIPPAM